MEEDRNGKDEAYRGRDCREAKPLILREVFAANSVFSYKHTIGGCVFPSKKKFVGCSVSAWRQSSQCSLCAKSRR
jgi:hypothetical protein